MENVQKYIDQAWSMILEYTPNVLLALLTLFIGLKIIVTIQVSKASFKRYEDVLVQ